MRLFIYISAAFLFTANVFGQHIEWDAPIKVADASFGSRTPRINLLKDGSPAVLWGKTGTGIYFSHLTTGASQFAAPSAIPTNGIIPGSKNERITVDFRTKSSKAGLFRLYATNGALVQTWEQTDDSKQVLTLNSLSSGIYFLDWLDASGQRLGRQQLVVE